LSFVEPRTPNPQPQQMSARRITDPKAIPVAGVDAHLPAVPLQQLTAQHLVQRFGSASAWEAEHAGDGGRFLSERGPAHAAVLVPLVQRAHGLQVLLTRRTDHLRDHAGQISFPGGRSEPHDPSPAGTALREAHEEVGLLPEHVQVIGQMPTYTTVTHFVVTPVVGLVVPPFELKLDSFEVAEAFEVPLAWLMNPAHHRRHVFSFDGGERQFLSMPWTGPGADGVEREYFIWGATAAMLRNLYRFLAG
jgi:8-oxo-dGTP pyrophosphatase MutT (NUDIX family)